MVVDPGDNIPQILAFLARRKLTLKQIVVTHGHIDHVGGAARLKKATGAPILLNQNDLPQLAMMDEQAAWLGVAPPEIVPPDESAEEGAMIGIAGHTARILHTPGHTEGSICLHFAPENLLLAGDTLFAGSIGRTDLPGGDGRKILRSLHDRLLILPGRDARYPRTWTGNHDWGRTRIEPLAPGRRPIVVAQVRAILVRVPICQLAACIIEQ